MTGKASFERRLHPTGSSDCPVESLNVMENIYSAMVRNGFEPVPRGRLETGAKPIT